MYIVPIALRPRGRDIQQVWVLLERNGTRLMTVDTVGNSPVSAAREFADANGLVLSSEPVESGTLVFLPVDIDATDFSSFYTWREVLPGTVPSKERMAPVCLGIRFARCESAVEYYTDRRPRSYGV